MKEHEIDQILRERDYWDEKATELANDIANALGFDVGVHSNINNPVQNAIDNLFEMLGQINEWCSANDLSRGVVRSEAYQIKQLPDDNLYWLASEGGEGEAMGLTVEQYNDMCGKYMDEHF